MAHQRLHALATWLERVADAIAWVGKAASWLILAILVTVMVSVVGGMLRVTRFLQWEGEVFLFGSGLTLNSVLDLQWYLFGVLLLLTGAYALHTNTHVRVDLFYSRLSANGKRLVEMIGDCVFLLPLCIVLIDRSMPLLELSYNTGERSNEDGLTHRWMIKMFVPIGFSLLAALAVTRVLRNGLALFGIESTPAKTEQSDRA